MPHFSTFVNIQSFADLENKKIEICELNFFENILAKSHQKI